MSVLERLKNRTGETDKNLLLDCLISAANAINARRYPFGDSRTGECSDTVDPQYQDLQYRIALEIYQRIGAEGEQSHSENGISRVYDGSWISSKLLEEVTPMCGVI